MTRSELEELATVVEEIRTELHPRLSPGFLRAVIFAEEASPDDDDGALRTIAKALTQTLEGEDPR
jgi:hypothetical protein